MEETQDPPLTPQQFSAKIKAKYPQYKDVDDVVLAKKMVEKYPEYAKKVSFGEVKKKKSLQYPLHKKLLGYLLRELPLQVLHRIQSHQWGLRLRVV